MSTLTMSMQTPFRQFDSVVKKVQTCYPWLQCKSWLLERPLFVHTP